MTIRKILPLLLAAFSVPLWAEGATYGDSVRVRTWSVYARGGLSWASGQPHSLYDRAYGYPDAEAALGGSLTLRPWVRLSLAATYSRVRQTAKFIKTEENDDPAFSVGNRPAVLHRRSDRLQCRDITDLAGGEAMAEFNIFETFRQARDQRVNVWIGVGVGYVHGFTRHAETWSHRDNALAEGEGYSNAYNHSYLESRSATGGYDALCLPASLSAEVDLSRRFTLSLGGIYRYIPGGPDVAPESQYGVTLGLRYNFTPSATRILSRRLTRLQADYEAAQKALREAGEKAAR